MGDQLVQTDDVYAASRSGGAAFFVLAVPGKIHRAYRGTIEVKSVAGTLVAVVGMDLETAVASALATESDPDSPLEALKAQAVATRSYLVAARGRHADFDFCDTTHCQFLGGVPALSSNAFRATAATRGLVLSYQDQALAAMFSRSCGGRTRTAQEIGIVSQGYPYYSVACDYCLRHAMRWTRLVSTAEARDLHLRGEAARLDLDRRFGWDFVPSDNFTVRPEAGSRKGQKVVLEGKGQGHGLGLCQQGAKAMAEAGASFQRILNHYYPNTMLTYEARSQEGRARALLR